jgi:hypothetical protein
MCLYKSIARYCLLNKFPLIKMVQLLVNVRITFNMLDTTDFWGQITASMMERSRCPRPLLLTGCEGNTAGCWTVAKGTYPKLILRGVTIHFFHKRYVSGYLICITIRFIGNCSYSLKSMLVDMGAAMFFFLYMKICILVNRNACYRQ